MAMFKKFLVFSLAVIAVFSLIFQCFPPCLAQAYTLTHDVQLQYPSNINYVITATLDPADSGSSGKIIDFKPSWLNLIRKWTDSYGKASINITMPQPTHYSITFSNPDNLFMSRTANFEVMEGIKPKLTYESVQYYDPESDRDILIYAEAKRTSADTIITAPSWDRTIILAPTSVSFTYEPQGSGMFLVKVGMTPDMGGTYKFRISASYLSFYVVPTEVTVNVGNQPILKVKLAFADGKEVWMAEKHSIDITRDTSYVDIYTYNTKGDILDATISKFTITEQLPESKVPEHLGKGHFRVWYTFSMSLATIDLEAGYGPYQTFRDNIQVATITTGFDLFKFIPLPWLILIVLAMIGGVIWLVRRRGRENSNERIISSM